MIFRVALTIAAAPILVAAVHNGIVGWYPARDTAITAIRANDVFSSHPPMIGLPAFPSTGTDLTYNYLGAPMMYLLALPVKVLGNSWGLLLTTALVNTGWLVTALWLIRRRVGYLAGTLACVFAATLVWGIGSQVLVDPTPVQSGVIASLTLMVAAWSVAECDPKAIIPLALAANFTLLNHLQFMAVTPLVVVAAILIARWRRRTLASGAPGGADAAPRRDRRPVIGAAVVTFVLWLPPLIDQFFFSSANLSQIVRAIGTATGDEGGTANVHRGLLDVIGVVSSPITQWPLWFRDSFAEPLFWVFGPTLGFVAGAVGLAVVGASCAFVMITAARRGDLTLVTGPVIIFVALVGWAISGLSSATADGWKLKYFHALWPLSMLLWFVICVGALRWIAGLAATRRLVDRVSTSRTPSIAAIVAVLVFAGATFPLADLGAGTPLDDVPIARQINRDVSDRVTSDVPVVATAWVLGRPYLPVVLLTLQEQGIEFRFRSPWDVRIYGANRVYRPDGGPPPPTIAVTTVPDLSKGSELVSAVGPDLGLTFERYFAIGRAISDWAVTVDTLELPDDAPLSDANRTQVDHLLATTLDDARSGHRNLASYPPFVRLVAALAHTGLLGTFEIPGVSGAELSTWFSAQQKVIDRATDRNGFVFVTFRPSPAA